MGKRRESNGVRTGEENLNSWLLHLCYYKKNLNKKKVRTVFWSNGGGACNVEEMIAVIPSRKREKKEGFRRLARSTLNEVKRGEPVHAKMGATVGRQGPRKGSLVERRERRGKTNISARRSKSGGDG